MEKENKILFRCHTLGDLMTDPREKSKDFGDTCMARIMEKYIQIMYGRSKELQSKFLEKGIAVEEDSITLLSRVKKKFYKKNEENLTNDYVSGTPDLFEGEKILSATHIVDIKSSWNIFTFFNSKVKPLDKSYYWQMQGYMWLTGAKTATVSFCLVDTPQSLIFSDQQKLLYSTGVDSENQMYIDACHEIEQNMTFADIPLKERVFEFSFERNEADIERLKERIDKCRKKLNEMLPTAMLASQGEEAIIIEPINI